MNDEQDPEPHAQADKHESVFGGRVIRIADEKGMFVNEDRFGFVK
jgi:hypothetical protein